MQTFLPSADYSECAKVLDNRRLNSQINESLVILRSLTKVYPPSPRTGISGWANHTVAKMWVGHELQLARYTLCMAEEFLKHRKLPFASKVESLESRKRRVLTWRGLVEQMEDRSFPDDPPVLVGDEEFHSAFRAWLLFKECQELTFKQWKHGKYPDHACHRNNLPKKASWKREHYCALWDYFGRPEPVWYAQWGWEEAPDDMRVFYTEDRVPQMLKEKRRKEERPYVPFLKPQAS